MKTRWPAYVVMNPGSSAGRGEARWEVLRSVLDDRLDVQRVYRLPSSEARWDPAYRQELAEKLRTAYDQGRRLFVAAGGDGTVQLLADAMMLGLTTEERGEVRVGAVGLGSSNDFHKPVDRVALLEGLPLRLDFRNAKPRDLGLIEVDPDSEHPLQRHFVVSASLGVVSLGNHIFNGESRFIRLLKSWWTGGAIAASAVSAVMRNRPVRVELAGSGLPARSTCLVHLGVMKSPHLAGNLCYDFDVHGSDGNLTVALVEDIGQFRQMAMLMALSRGRFSGRPGTQHLRTSDITATCEAPVLLEADGETLTGRKFRFSAVPAALWVCGPGLPIDRTPTTTTGG